jgi:protein-disulfide isomerase
MRSGRFLFLARGALALALIVAGCGLAAAQRDRAWRDQSVFAIIGDNDERVPNHPVPGELAATIEQQPGVVVVGNKKGRVTLVEFYDLNCPFCRIAAVDVADMVETDPDLRLVLVAYPVLGDASVAAARIELAVARLAGPEQFYEFHRKIYSRRGVVDAARAFDVAHELNLDKAHLIALAASDEIGRAVEQHVQLGRALGIAATPGFVVGGVAVLGYPGRRSLQGLVDAVSSCDKVVC